MPLTYLDTKASEANNQDMGCAHPLHSLMPQHIQLPAVQRFINIAILELAKVHARPINLHFHFLHIETVVSQVVLSVGEVVDGGSMGEV